MSRADTWMPLYIGDYLSDTMHLNGAEHGAYLLLLMHQWRSGPLPDDDRQLAAIARTDTATWRKVGPVVRKFFQATPEGLVQKRLAAERAKADGIISKRAEAGKRGAASRWNDGQSVSGGGSDSEGGEGGKPIANAMANAMANAQQTDGPSPSPLQKEKRKPVLRTAEVDVRGVLWTEGLARLRRITGKPDGAARGLLGKFCRDANDDCALVGSLLHEAERDMPGDPIPWITAAILTRTGRRASPQKPKSNVAWMNPYASETRQ